MIPPENKYRVGDTVVARVKNHAWQYTIIASRPNGSYVLAPMHCGYNADALPWTSESNIVGPLAPRFRVGDLVVRMDTGALTVVERIDAPGYFLFNNGYMHEGALRLALPDEIQRFLGYA